MKEEQFAFFHLPNRDELFIQQIDAPQYLFQVLEFQSEQQLVEAVSKMQDRVVRIMPSFVCLRFSGNLQHVDISQENYNDILADIDRVRKAAALWMKSRINDFDKKSNPF